MAQFKQFLAPVLLRVSVKAASAAPSGVTLVRCPIVGNHRGQVFAGFPAEDLLDTDNEHFVVAGGADVRRRRLRGRR